MANTPNVALPLWAASQASPWLTVDSAFRILDAFAVAVIVDEMDRGSPPGTSADGGRYLVANPASGDWTGHEGELAISLGVNASNGWQYADISVEGMLLRNREDDTNYRYTSGSFVAFADAVSRLQDLTDVDTGGLADGYVLKWDASNQLFYFAPDLTGGGGAGSVVVNDEGVAQGAAAVFNFVGAGVSASVAGGTATITITGGGAAATRLQDLTDVDVTGLADGLVLKWDASNGLFYFSRDLGWPFASAAEIKAMQESGKTIAPDQLALAAKPQTLTDQATIAWDMSLGWNAKVTLGASRTLGTPTNPVEGITYTLNVIQDGTGSRLLTLPASFKFGAAGAPTLSTGAGKLDFISLYCYDAATPAFRATFSKDS